MPSPESVLLIGTAGIALLLVLSLKNPFYGLLAYFGVMITRTGLYYPALGAIRIELIVGLFVLLQILLRGRLFTKKLGLNYNPVSKYIFLFFLVILVSFSQAWDYGLSWNYAVLEFIKVYVFFIMVITLVESEIQIRQFLWAFAIFTILIDYEGLYFYFTGKSTYVLQGINVAIASEGFASGHVAAANMQLQCLPVMVYLVLGEKKTILKIIACSLVFLSIIGVIASGSRGGFLGLIIFLFLVVYFSKRRMWSLILCGLGVIISIPFLSATYLNWMSSIINYTDEVSASSRVGGLINGLEMMIKRPLLGVGPGCYSLARKAWFGWGLEAHNHYGQLMGELGIIGTVVWGFLIYSIFKNLREAKTIFKVKGKTNIYFIIISIQIAILVRLFEGMFSHSLYVFFWYMMAALSIVIVKIMEINKVSNNKRDTEILSPKV